MDWIWIIVAIMGLLILSWMVYTLKRSAKHKEEFSALDDAVKRAGQYTKYRKQMRIAVMVPFAVFLLTAASSCLLLFLPAFEYHVGLGEWDLGTLPAERPLFEVLQTIDEIKAETSSFPVEFLSCFNIAMIWILAFYALDFIMYIFSAIRMIVDEDEYLMRSYEAVTYEKKSNAFPRSRSFSCAFEFVWVMIRLLVCIVLFYFAYAVAKTGLPAGTTLLDEMGVQASPTWSFIGSVITGAAAFVVGLFGIGYSRKAKKQVCEEFARLKN